ncbi:MAG TPA: TIR domain-containing protein, partial [Thermoanaerobaculia bacterium]|nr:TIR domain-containing protein [Thermoanaerobaculia bacterium]
APSDPEEFKQSALTSLALLFLKAKVLTSFARDAIRDALAAAQNSGDPEISGFALRAFPADVLRKTRDRKPPRPNRNDRPRILLIHGRDELNLHRLETFMSDQLGLSVEVLRYPPGRSMIEVMEAKIRGISFAMVLLTPDDVVDVDVDVEGTHYTARPNVLLELGWVYARLGRPRVCILVKKGTRLPSDLSGIKRIDFTDSVLEFLGDVSRFDFVENVLEVSSQLHAELELAGVA